METMIDALYDVVLTEPETEVRPDPVRSDDIAVEAELTQEISALWSDHVRLSANHKTTAKELRQIRAKLAERLYAIKQLLCRVGRGGQWRGWLKERHIPRSSADRFCERHAETLGIKNEIAPSGAINGGEDTVEQLVQTLLPRLRPKLADAQAVFKFIAAVGEAFGLRSETTEDCIMVSQPKEQNEPTAAATGAPEAASAEVQSPGPENSSDGIAAQADTAETNGGSD
jgi:hypothetical protein